MSRKASIFAGVITNPLNVHNFECIIPGIPREKAMIIESTTFPTEKFRVLTLWFQGEKVLYPGLPENDNSWKFKIPESDSAVIATEFQRIKDSMYNQKSGVLTPIRYKDLEVRARDLAGNIVFKVLLHGAWFRARDAASLSASNPGESWKWDYEFVFEWIEDIINKVDGTPVLQ